MKLGDHMCIVPFAGSNRDRSNLLMLEKEAADEDFEFVRGGSKPRSSKKNLPQKSPSSSKAAAVKRKSRNPKSMSKDDALKDSSERITFSRLVSILRDAYITTMKSFASKPGGLGGMVMGGKIDLPDATPSRTFREPRNFVRSWSQRRPDYISSPGPDYVSSPAPDFARRAHPGLAA